MYKYLIAGNWKMNKTSAEAKDLAAELVDEIGAQAEVNVAICPPLTALGSLASTLDGSTIALGAQNMHPEPSGAYTGEVSASMLRELFAKYVILGHSERREYFKESNEFINKKVHAALEASLRPILCVGESQAERDAGKTFDVIKKQLSEGLAGVAIQKADKVIIAYEPIWAIGTGKTATPEMAQEVHTHIRELLAGMYKESVARKISIIYGGSMNAQNAKSLLEQKDIDGGLIGGASLKARDFAKIVNIAVELSRPLSESMLESAN